MVWIRGRTCYVKRRLPGIGPVVKSLGTTKPERGRKLEDMIVTLCERARLDLVNAWLDGRLEVEQLADAYESNNLARLTQSLRDAETRCPSLGDAIRDCMAAREGDVADSTLKRYKEGLAHFERLRGKETPVDEALRDIQDFRAARRREKAAKETANNDLIAVSVLATYCVGKGWIAERPKIKKYRTKVRINYLEPDQLRVYMASLRRPFRTLFQLLVGTGMRYGEAAALRVCDLRFGSQEARALIADSKSGQPRNVFIPAWAADALRQEIEDRGLSGADEIFTIPYDTVYDEHKRACKLAGIHDYTIHDHRHTAAVSLCRAGMPLNILAQQLGHTTIAMTMRYAGFNVEYSDAAPYLDRVAKAYGLAPSNSPGNTPTEAEAEATA